jgi:hypothetical protein
MSKSKSTKAETAARLAADAVADATVVAAAPVVSDAAVATVKVKGKPGRKAKPLDLSAALTDRASILKVLVSAGLPHAFVRGNMTWGIELPNGETVTRTYKDMTGKTGQELLDELLK